METSDCIIEGLYLGGILAALNENDLSAKEITHILSVDESPLPDTIVKSVTYKHLEALDVDECDLLSCFSDTFVFIEQARSVGGRVLVHCQAGMSRSATVLCAYLMQKMSTSRNKALDLIAAGRPSVRPNAGFMNQLELFESMGCQLIKTHPLYRSFRLKKIADKFHKGYLSTGASEVDVLSDVLLDTDFSTQGSDAYYKCRKCRCILFRHGAVTSHIMGRGESAFDWRGVGPSKHQQSLVEEQDVCQKSLFVDPLLWMKGKIGETSGKLHCPKCDIKIGSYVWYGEKCPCGTWVAPAFHIDSGKVDKIPFQTVLPNVRMVRGAGGATPDAGANQPTTTSLPYRALPRDQFGRSLRTKSGNAIVAAVAPMVSASASILSGDSVTMEVENTAGSASSSSSLREHNVPISNPSMSRELQENSFQMDVDS